MKIKKLVCAVLALLLLPLLCSQSNAQVELTIQNRGDFLLLDLTIEATGITTVAGSEARFVSDSQGMGFFPYGSGQFLSFPIDEITLGGVPLDTVNFVSTETQNTIEFEFRGPIPAGTDLSDLNGTYTLRICTSCERVFEAGTYQAAFDSGIDFGDVALNVLPFVVGDVSGDGVVNFLDIAPFIAVLTSGDDQSEADIDRNATVNFLDIAPFIELLSGQ